MLNTEFHDWNAAHTYTEAEKILWLLNAIKTLEEKLKLAYDNNNNLYSIIKQQQTKAHEISNRTAVVHPEVVRLQKEIEAYKQHIQTLNAEITNLRTSFHEQQRRLSAVYDAAVGNSR